MSVLALKLSGPLQSWGASSRFTQRTTEPFPTKSGILGLLAAAQGRRRSDPIEDLVGLELAVRVDQPGTMLRDFHTAHQQRTGAAMPLTNRYYWSDAVYTAHIQGPDPLLEGLAVALGNPAYPLYFGRRSCVPDSRVVMGISPGTIAESVKELPWQAGHSGRVAHSRQATVSLAVQADQSAFPDMVVSRELSDVPVSWNPERRSYHTRMVVQLYVELATGFTAAAPASSSHDPMATLGSFT